MFESSVQFFSNNSGTLTAIFEIFRHSIEKFFHLFRTIIFSMHFNLLIVNVEEHFLPF